MNDRNRELLRTVAGAADPVKLTRRGARWLHEHGMIYVVDQCPTGCCRVYRVTPGGLATLEHAERSDD